MLPEAERCLLPDAGGQVGVGVGGQSFAGFRGGRGQQETDQLRALKPGSTGIEIKRDREVDSNQYYITQEFTELQKVGKEFVNDGMGFEPIKAYTR